MYPARTLHTQGRVLSHGTLQHGVFHQHLFVLEIVNFNMPDQHRDLPDFLQHDVWDNMSFLLHRGNQQDSCFCFDFRSSTCVEQQWCLQHVLTTINSNFVAANLIQQLCEVNTPDLEKSNKMGPNRIASARREPTPSSMQHGPCRPWSKSNTVCFWTKRQSRQHDAWSTRPYTRAPTNRSGGLWQRLSSTFRWLTKKVLYLQFLVPSTCPDSTRS